ncbi:DUF2169 domain-containing protein [Enhygromyxa salina]|uniref:DUF2169 domain-containing protein n=1 Tax=Enhygromyxa salina TaxID=215803 RepID=A0A2S9YXC4_9BACT|nr:DUF2169 domain-containing protein [Enhygromyxa salina]PRQ09743.1 hypothetical protein ENSA7_04980 [Enhygromyxa salina]
MLFENLTQAPASLHVADFGTDHRHAVVVWKRSYDLQSGLRGEWALCDEPLPIIADPLHTPYGVFHGDVFLSKLGVDLCVLGRIRRSDPTTSTIVTIRCGSFTHALRVTGDRLWRRGLGGLVPSAPKPFLEMELSYSRAYGGVTRAEGMDVSFPDNPIGRGYFLEQEAALEGSLPNIEAQRAPPISAWDERPSPAGWGPYPMYWGLSARAGLSIDPQLQAVSEISPSLFNNAHPELVMAAIAGGEQLELKGVRDDRIAFDLPVTRGKVRVSIGSDRFDVPTRVDGVYLWLEEERLVITQRANFNYTVHPEQVRIAALLEI